MTAPVSKYKWCSPTNMPQMLNSSAASVPKEISVSIFADMLRA
jgi:hypothetical protein